MTVRNQHQRKSRQDCDNRNQNQSPTKVDPVHKEAPLGLKYSRTAEEKGLNSTKVFPAIKAPLSSVLQVI